MNNQFTQGFSDILNYSKEEAYRLGNDAIEPGHLLLAILREGKGNAFDIMVKLNINIIQLKAALENNLTQGKRDLVQPEQDIPFSPVTSRILKICMLEARLLKSNVIGTGHVLLSILRDDDNQAASILKENGMVYQMVFDQLSIKSTNLNAGMGVPEEEEEDDDIPQYKKKTESELSSAQTSSSKVSNDTPALDTFGIDLTRAAAEGKLDPVIGRDKEIERVAQILSRRKKNNPVLIGEPGVGKSAIVEGLALRIIEKKVSRILFNKRVVMLDMASVVAGTKYRGQFEERINSIIHELRKNPDIILFIDEIHTIVGAGAAAGSMDAANILKPALARGEIQCIGATTLDEYRKSIEKDGALDRRFQKIIVEPTTPEETLQILKNIKERYENHHNVIYTEEALDMCVKLSDRYITDRYFPDKAIDVLDEAGSRIHLTNINVPKEIEEQEKLIENARNMKAAAVKSQNFELAASYRDNEKNLSARLDKMKLEWESTLKNNKQIVNEDDIANVVSMMSGIPVQRMAQAEGVRLALLKETLQSQIIAQDIAIEKLTKAIIRSRAGLKDPNRPIGSFMFLGPTGVGKTHLAKMLAKYLFGSSDALIRIDMSEYMEKYTVSRMIGAAPGYVGYEEGGQLTEKVRRKPYSIILLDEIEKAHPDVFNILLQVLDEGRLTDNYGRTVDFKNTIMILTSNIGTRQLKDFGKGIGFSSKNRTDDKDYSHSIIQKALNKTFAPEFLNRLDEIIIFDQLSLDAVIKIINIELSEVLKRIESIGYKIYIDDEAKTFLATKGYDVQFGARPLKRTIQKYLEDKLSELIISSEIVPGDTLQVSLNHNNDGLDINKL